MAVYSCGANKVGQLGLGTFDDSFDPSVLELLKGKRITSVKAGEQHSLALTEFGDVYTWGRGREGQLGTGLRQNVTNPVHIKGLRHERITSADCGSYHCVVVSETGRVYIWGKIHKREEKESNKKFFGHAVQMVGMHSEFAQEMVEESIKAYLAAGQEETADADINNVFGNFVSFNQVEPILVQPLLQKKIVDVAAGYSFSVAISSEGETYTWGFNEKGQLGHGNRFNVEEPKLVEALKGVFMVKAEAGQQHTVVLSDRGEVYTCGLGVFGQLGHGDLRDQMIPKRIEFLVETNQVVKEIACGSYYTVLVNDKGELYSFGHSEYGQQGGLENYRDWSVGETQSRTTKDKQHYHAIPRVVQGLEGKQVKQVSCGHLHSVVVTIDNEVYSWGWGSSGCLGHGDRRFQLFPKQITTLQGETISQIASGWKHSLIVKSGDVSTFAFDFKNLVDSKLYSDMKFILDGKTIHAHKVIVFNRCPHMETVLLFQNRFLHKTEKTSEIIIKGVRYLAFMHFLRYLYTDHLKCPAHLAREVEKLAKQFRLPRLVNMAARFRYTENAITIQPSTFSADLAKAVNTSNHADVTFMVQGEKVFGHRSILTRRSAYFEQLLSPDSSFLERDMNTFTIDDTISVPSFISALTYLYTNDESVITPDNAIYLLQVADRFMMEDFKQVIEAYIEQSIEPDNSCWLLEISDKYGAYRLKRSCVELICESDVKTWETVKTSKGIIELKQSAPHLLRELDYRASKRNLIRPGELFRIIPAY